MSDAATTTPTTEPALAQIPVPRPKGQHPDSFGHIVLQSPQFKEMRDFYMTLLNAQPMFENDVVTFLTFDDEHHRILVFNKPDAKPKDPDAAGLAHFAYAFDTLHDLLMSYKRLRDDHQMVPAYCVNHGFMTSFYYHDPDGNEVELGVDNFETLAETNAWLAKGLFNKNFFGFMCDPAKMLEMHENNVPDAEVFAETYK